MYVGFGDGGGIKTVGEERKSLFLNTLSLASHFNCVSFDRNF
jgi:hypothetical protein